MLSEATACPLCRGDNAEVVPAIVPGGGVRANRLAVACPVCRGYLIESSLVRDGAIPADVGKTLSAQARQRYRDDGSDMLEVTEAMVRAFSR